MNTQFFNLRKQASSTKQGGEETSLQSPSKKDNADNEGTADESSLLQQNNQQDEVQQLIRNQRYKVKFKFSIDDNCTLANPIITLMGNLNKFQITKMSRKLPNRSMPGPLLEKKFLQNDKIQYYVKRYWPVKGRHNSLKESSQYMDELNIDDENDNSVMEICHDQRTDSVLGLKLRPNPDGRRKPPRSRVYGVYPQNNNGQSQSRNLMKQNSSKNQDNGQQNEDAKEGGQNNAYSDANTQLFHHQDQSTTLSTTGMNVQNNNLGDISCSHNASPLKQDLNFWHSGNPALNLITNVHSPTKKASMIGQYAPQCNSPLEGGNKDLINLQNDQFFVRRTSSKMGPRGLIRVTKNSQTEKDNAILAQSQEVRSSSLNGIVSNSNLSHNEYLQRVLQDIAQTSSSQLKKFDQIYPLGSSTSESMPSNLFAQQSKRPVSLFKSIPSSKQQIQISKQAARGAYVKIDRSIGGKQNNAKIPPTNNQQTSSRGPSKDIYLAQNFQAGASTHNNHEQFKKYVFQQQLLLKQKQQELQQALHSQIIHGMTYSSAYQTETNTSSKPMGDLNWSKSFHLNHSNLFASNSHNLASQSSLPQTTFSSSFKSGPTNAYDMISHQKGKDDMVRNPLKSAIMPTKASFGMNQQQQQSIQQYIVNNNPQLKGGIAPMRPHRAIY